MSISSRWRWPKLLKGVVDGEGPGLVLCGKQAIDNDMNATGQMLSALLCWPQGTFCSEVAIEGDAAVITCEVDGSPQTLNVAMPAVPTVDLRLNETKTTLAHSMPTGARLSRAFSPLDGTTFLSGEVAAVLHWRRENGDEDYNHLLHRDAWEVVLPELVFEAGVGAVMADQNGS